MILNEPEMENYYIASVMLTENIGCMRTRQLLDHFISGEGIWKADREALEATEMTPSIVNAFINFRNLHPDCPYQLIEYCEKKKIKLCSIRDYNYPELLKKEKDAPVLLYYRGELNPIEPRIGIVGTRRPTPYGKRVAMNFAEEIASVGATVVSGAAVGIDTFAHLGAIKNGRTIAVLGEGLEVNMARDKIKLLDQIIENGAVISEYSPNTTPSKGTFPHRNRIIAGMSLGVVIIEAGEKSGAMNTAQHAGNYGRLLFAVPGNIYSEKSRGCHQLIRDGAILVRSAEDVFTQCKCNFDNSELRNKVVGLQPLEGKEEEVMNIIPMDIGISADDILIKLDEIGIAEINMILVSLENKGYIEEDMFGNYVRLYGK